MKNPIVFIFVIIIVVALEVLLIWGIGAWVCRMLGCAPVPVWVCIVLVLLLNVILGKYASKKGR